MPRRTDPVLPIGFAYNSAKQTRGHSLQIAQELGVEQITAGRSRQRYVESGLAGERDFASRGTATPAYVLKFRVRRLTPMARDDTVDSQVWRASNGCCRRRDKRDATASWSALALRSASLVTAC